MLLVPYRLRFTSSSCHAQPPRTLFVTFKYTSASSFLRSETTILHQASLRSKILSCISRQVIILVTSWVTLLVFGVSITLCSSFDMTFAAIIICISPTGHRIASQLIPAYNLLTLSPITITHAHVRTFGKLSTTNIETTCLVLVVKESTWHSYHKESCIRLGLQVLGMKLL
jgi:hypothetical protein